MLKTVGNPSTRFGDQTIINGNLVIGTAGKGIDFSASPHSAGMTSELLDDYEEGTFTPTVQGTTSAGTATYSIQVGRYVKVGDVVHFQISLAWSGHTGTGNIAGVYGLPFAAANVTNNYSTHSVCLDTLSMTAGNVLQTFLGQAQSNLSLRQAPTGGGGLASIPLPTSIGFLFITGSYQTA